MTADINAEPDYGDEPPIACSSSVQVHGGQFACGGTPGHAGLHAFSASGRGTMPKISIEWYGDQAAPAPRPSPEVVRAAFAGFMASQGYDDQGCFDHDEMELAFETGMYVQAAAPAGQAAPVCPGCRQPFDPAKGCIRTCACIGPAETTQHPEQPQAAPERRAFKEYPGGFALEGLQSMQFLTEAQAAPGIHDGCTSTIAGLEKDRDVARRALESIASGAQGSLDTAIPLDREWVRDRALRALGWAQMPDPDEYRGPQPQAAPDPDGQQRYIDQLHDLVRDILTDYIGEPSAGSVEYWRRAGQLHVCDSNGRPFGEQP